MNKLMLASLSLLLVGVTAVPAQAQEQRRWNRDRGGDAGQVDASGNEQTGRVDGGQRQESREEVRQEARQDNRQELRQEARQDLRQEARREYRQDVRQEARQDYRQEVRQEARQDARQAVRQEVRQDARRDARQNYGQVRDDQRYVGTSGSVEDRRDGRYGDRNDRYDSRNDRYDNRYDSRYDNRYDSGRYDVSRYSRHDDRRWNGNHWYPQYRYRAPVRYVYPRGYRAYQWRVGHRLPSSYYSRNYYVDYNAYRLPPPPYGYHWVRVDRDVVLVAIASGLIRDILYGLYY